MSILDNAWHAGQAKIPPGTFQLQFDVNGDDFRGGFDDIKVTPGMCPPLGKCLLRYSWL